MTRQTQDTVGINRKRSRKALWVVWRKHTWAQSINKNTWHKMPIPPERPLMLQQGIVQASPVIMTHTHTISAYSNYPKDST